MRDVKKENRGITLVSLVVTIIILIILAGVSINMTLGEGGLITIAKRAKENMELAQIEEQEQLNILYSQLEENKGTTEENTNYEAIAKLNNFKKAIADYIEEAGGIKPDYTADAETFGERIKGIVKEVTKDATATAEDILTGKTAWVNGNKITGINKLGQITQMTQIKLEKSISGGNLNYNSKTIKYKFTEEDLNKGYNFFVFNIYTGGAGNVSYADVNNMNAPKGAISIKTGYHCYDTSYNSQVNINNDFVLYGFLCIIPTKELKVGDEVSVDVYGIYNLYIGGVN